MCGRYVSASPPDELARYFGAQTGGEQLEESYNVAPTDAVYGVRARDGHRQLETLRWGLVPFWAKDPKIGSRMINARAESVADKPAFRRAYEKRRCLLPADGFFEWEKIAGQKRKQPWFIHRVDDEPLVFAGLWEFWTAKDDDGADTGDPVVSCTIITTTANETMAPIHDRMPVMIPPNAWDRWLDPDTPGGDVADLLVPAPDGLLARHTITTAVNSVRNDGPDLIAEAAPLAEADAS